MVDACRLRPSLETDFGKIELYQILKPPDKAGSLEILTASGIIQQSVERRIILGRLESSRSDKLPDS